MNKDIYVIGFNQSSRSYLKKHPLQIKEEEKTNNFLIDQTLVGSFFEFNGFYQPREAVILSWYGSRGDTEDDYRIQVQNGSDQIFDPCTQELLKEFPGVLDQILNLPNQRMSPKELCDFLTSQGLLDFTQEVKPERNNIYLF